MKAAIAPSLLSGNFLNLLADIRLMEKSEAKVLHLDVMDGHFVPNLTFGPPTVRAIREVTDLTLDVHLMIANAEQTFKDYIGAGADFVSVHVEAVANLEDLLCEITNAGAKAGCCLKSRYSFGSGGELFRQVPPCFTNVRESGIWRPEIHPSHVQ